MSLPPADWVAETGWGAGEALAAAVPWEDSQRKSLPALLATLWQILLSPRQFFAALAHTGGLGEPLGFVLLVGTTGLLSLLFWQIVLASIGTEALSAGLLANYFTLLQDDPRLVFGLVLLIPFYIAVSQFLLSIVLLAALRLVEGANVSYEMVFRVVAYAQAPAVLAIIPFLGGLLARLWQLVLLVLGISQTLRVSVSKALCSLILAILLLSLMFALFLLFLGFLGLYRLLWS